MLIKGEWISTTSGGTIPAYNPATGELAGEVPKAGSDEANAACEAAAEAFRSWRSVLPRARRDLLARAAALLRERAEEMARTLTAEQGKPLSEARGEIKAAIQAVDYYAEAALRIKGELLPPSAAGVRNLVIRQPVGPVVAISPWNYPVLLTAWKVAPALAAGCTVVVKPASQTPLAATAFVKCLADAGAPAGVVNVVTGPGNSVGNVLVSHPLIRKISLTGETGTGKTIMKAAADTVKRLTLELGGHCPMIVAADADLEAAVKEGVYRSFRNMGQICNAINRIYVEQPVYDEFVRKFAEHTRRLVIGDGLENPEADLGPMANASGLETVKAHVADAVEKGARLLHGGNRPAGEKYARGHFIEPAVLADVNHSMLVMTEETFGPVAPIMPVKDLDEAVALANDSIYGLVAYVYTRDLAKGWRIAEALEAGTVGINNVSGGEVDFPYGGWKQSGFGVELSEQGLYEYMAIKHIRAKS